jgi:two-component system, NarL family, sensor kinase
VALTSWVRRPVAVAAVLAWAVVLLAGSGYAVVVAHEREASLGRLLSIASVVVPFTVVGWLIARQVPGNPIGWLCLGFGLVESLSFIASTVAEQALVTAPGSLPLGREAAWISDSTWWLGPVAVLPPLLLLFPTGRPPTRRWWVVAWLLAAGLVLAWVPLAVGSWPARGSSFTGEGALAGERVVVPLALTGAVMLGVAFIASLASVFVRLRHARDVERRQLGWFALGVGTTAAGVVGLFLLPEELYFLVFVTLPAVPVSVGVAILREQLFDISLVLNRTIVYVALTLLLVGVYVAISATAGLLLGGRATIGLAVLATAIVAALAQPLRARLQRAVNRLMFGDRHDPHELLARLEERLAAGRAPDELLREAVGTVTRALPFSRVEVRTRAAGVVAEGNAVVPADLTLPLEHQGQRVGELLLGGLRAGDRISDRDRLLLARVARQIAAVAHTADLTAELRRSRQQVVTAREEERRRLRRDLHDGLGPSLAAIGAGLEAALDDDLPMHDRQRLLSQLLGGSAESLAEVRRLVYQLRPPSLDELGLVEAVRTLALEVCRSGPEVTVLADPLLESLPASVEVAAYRIAAEAVTNVARHAHATRCVIELRQEPEGLLVEVRDDGRGPTGQPGVGMQAMRERADELGGTLTVDAPARGGTVVRARLPLEGT